jgi:hypothetical protein
MYHPLIFAKKRLTQKKCSLCCSSEGNDEGLTPAFVDDVERGDNLGSTDNLPKPVIDIRPRLRCVL